MRFDLTLFEYIFSFTNQSYWLDFAGHFLSFFLPYILILILILLSIKDGRMYRFMTLKAIAAGFFTKIFLIIPIQRLIPRERPFVFFDFPPLISRVPSPSFPSSHAAFFFTLSTVSFFGNKKLGIFFYVCSLLIIIARVYAGVHWPSDVIVGALIGIITGLVIQKITERKSNENKVN